MASPLIIATLAAGLSGFAAPQAGLQADAFGRVVQVASDCSSAASRVVEETGGELLSVSSTKDGQTCIVIVLVQGNGERPRKVTMRVPR